MATTESHPMLGRFLPRVDFASYEDFRDNYQAIIPENFNFAYDVVDEWALLSPDKPALVWVNDRNEEKRYSFAEVKRWSDKAASMFRSLGLGKGDTVMLMLKQRPEVWFLMLGLHKLGGIVIPATYQLTAKDIVYRVQAADVKMICAADDPEIVKHANEAMPQIENAPVLSILGAEVPRGWRSLRSDLDGADENWTRPDGAAGTTNRDPMLIYFSSGTTGMPKMILHDFDYPIGHIITAKYWQRVEDGGLHLTGRNSAGEKSTASGSAARSSSPTTRTSSPPRTLSRRWSG